MHEKRQDIQGLRALAVVLVVAYHLWPARLSGGYVGVDVFFVISGFLITAHLVSEAQRTGSISLTQFWARRIRRLLPAGFVVLAFSLVAAFAILPKTLLEQALQEIAASALYIENWVLSVTSVGYMAVENKPSLVQHFWSLSVEEQFYIAWPIILLVVLLVVKKYRTGSSYRVPIAITLGVIFLASLAFSIADTASSPASAYFITPTRAWEFAAGGLLTFVPAKLPSALRRVEGAWRLSSSWIGLGLIVLSALLYDAGTPFPGYTAALPVLGTLLMIHSGEYGSRWSPSYPMSFGPVQLVGDLSYSIYLWHWPLIVLFPFVFGHGLTLKGRLLIVGVTLVLAIATKYLVEDPARRAKLRMRTRRVAFGFMAAGIAALVGVSGVTLVTIGQARAAYAAQLVRTDSCFGAYAMVTENECADPFTFTDDIDLSFAATDSYRVTGLAVKLYGVGGNDPCPFTKDGSLHDCEFGASEHPEFTIALVGDSHAAALLDPLVTYADAHNWRVVLYTLPGCAGFESVGPGPAEKPWSQSCRDWATYVQGELTGRDDIDAVAYINLTGGKMFDAPEIVDRWDEVRATGKKVVVIRDFPGVFGVGEVDASRAATCLELRDTDDDPCSWSPPPHDDYMTKALALEGGAVPLVDLWPYVCTDGHCHSVIGGVVVYFDSNHLSYTFGQTLSPFLGAEIEKTLSRM